MYALASSSTSWFGARTIVASAMVLLALATVLVQAQDGCKVECYPNTRLINGKGGIGKGDNCRWILRTDGKAARLCDHIKCKKVCPNNQAASSSSSQQQEQQETAASASDNLRIEQQTEPDSPLPASAPAGGESMGIMRQLHGSKLAKAPVPGVAGGRLTPAPATQQPQPQQQSSSSNPGRRMAPTLPPAVEYDEKDTPPPISRFLDISPEE